MIQKALPLVRNGITYKELQVTRESNYAKRGAELVSQLQQDLTRLQQLSGYAQAGPILARLNKAGMELSLYSNDWDGFSQEIFNLILLRSSTSLPQKIRELRAHFDNALARTTPLPHTYSESPQLQR